MSFVFVDTAGWLALLNSRDGLHPQAVKVRGDLQRRRVGLITTEFILIEVADSFAQPPLRAVMEAFTSDHHYTQAGFVRLLSH